MSHFTNLQTMIKSKTDLVKCLEELGYKIIETARVHGYDSESHVDFAVATAQGGYQIGFRLHGDTYEIVADWWGVKGETKKQFTSKLLIAYAERKVRAFAKRKKLRVVEEKAAEGKQFVLVRRAYKNE